MPSKTISEAERGHYSSNVMSLVKHSLTRKMVMGILVGAGLFAAVIGGVALGLFTKHNNEVKETEEKWGKGILGQMTGHDNNIHKLASDKTQLHRKIWGPQVKVVTRKDMSVFRLPLRGGSSACYIAPANLTSLPDDDTMRRIIMQAINIEDEEEEDEETFKTSTESLGSRENATEDKSEETFKTSTESLESKEKNPEQEKDEETFKNSTESFESKENDSAEEIEEVSLESIENDSEENKGEENLSNSIESTGNKEKHSGEEKNEETVSNSTESLQSRENSSAEKKREGALSKSIESLENSENISEEYKDKETVNDSTESLQSRENGSEEKKDEEDSSHSIESLENSENISEEGKDTDGYNDSTGSLKSRENGSVEKKSEEDSSNSIVSLENSENVSDEEKDKDGYNDSTGSLKSRENGSVEKKSEEDSSHSIESLENSENVSDEEKDKDGYNDSTGSLKSRENGSVEKKSEEDSSNSIVSLENSENVSEEEKDKDGYNDSTGSLKSRENGSEEKKGEEDSSHSIVSLENSENVSEEEKDKDSYNDSTGSLKSRENDSEEKKGEEAFKNAIESLENKEYHSDEEKGEEAFSNSIGSLENRENDLTNDEFNSKDERDSEEREVKKEENYRKVDIAEDKESDDEASRKSIESRSDWENSQGIDEESEKSKDDRQNDEDDENDRDVKMNENEEIDEEEGENESTEKQENFEEINNEDSSENGKLTKTLGSEEDVNEKENHSEKEEEQDNGEEEDGEDKIRNAIDEESTEKELSVAEKEDEERGTEEEEEEKGKIEEKDVSDEEAREGEGGGEGEEDEGTEKEEYEEEEEESFEKKTDSNVDYDEEENSNVSNSEDISHREGVKENEDKEKKESNKKKEKDVFEGEEKEGSGSRETFTKMDSSLQEADRAKMTNSGSRRKHFDDNSQETTDSRIKIIDMEENTMENSLDGAENVASDSGKNRNNIFSETVTHEADIAESLFGNTVEDIKDRRNDMIKVDNADDQTENALNSRHDFLMGDKSEKIVPKMADEFNTAEDAADKRKYIKEHFVDHMRNMAENERDKRINMIEDKIDSGIDTMVTDGTNIMMHNLIGNIENRIAGLTNGNQNREREDKKPNFKNTGGIGEETIDMFNSMKDITESMVVNLDDKMPGGSLRRDMIDDVRGLGENIRDNNLLEDEVKQQDKGRFQKEPLQGISNNAAAFVPGIIETDFVKDIVTSRKEVISNDLDQATAGILAGEEPIISTERRQNMAHSVGDHIEGFLETVVDRKKNENQSSKRANTIQDAAERRHVVVGTTVDIATDILDSFSDNRQKAETDTLKGRFGLGQGVTERRRHMTGEVVDKTEDILETNFDNHPNIDDKVSTNQQIESRKKNIVKVLGDNKSKIFTDLGLKITDSVRRDFGKTPVAKSKTGEQVSPLNFHSKQAMVSTEIIDKDVSRGKREATIRNDFKMRFTKEKDILWPEAAEMCEESLLFWLQPTEGAEKTRERRSSKIHRRCLVQCNEHCIRFPNQNSIVIPKVGRMNLEKHGLQEATRCTNLCGRFCR